MLKNLPSQLATNLFNVHSTAKAQIQIFRILPTAMRRIVSSSTIAVIERVAQMHMRQPGASEVKRHETVPQYMYVL